MHHAPCTMTTMVIYLKLVELTIWILKRSFYVHGITVLIDKIAEAFDKKHTIGLFLDFAKVFNTANNDILLTKLAHYGIRVNVLQWIQNYLAKRKQKVIFHGINSAL